MSRNPLDGEPSSGQICDTGGGPVVRAPFGGLVVCRVMRERAGDDEPVTTNSVSGEVFGAVVQAGRIAGGVHVHAAAGAPVRASVAKRVAQRPPWLARLLYSDGRVAGAGTSWTHTR